eukprot:s735_g31.t1
MPRCVLQKISAKKLRYGPNPCTGTPGVQPKTASPTSPPAPFFDSNLRPPLPSTGPASNCAVPTGRGRSLIIPMPDAVLAIWLAPDMLFSSAWARDKGNSIAGIPVNNLHPAHFLYRGWNSYWLRWIAQGKEVYFVVARTKPEMVLVGEVLTQTRNQALDIDAAATNHAVQTQASQAKNLAVKVLAQHFADCLRQKIPVETDQESQARVRELESQLGDLQQQLQRQKNAAGAPAHSTSLPGTPPTTGAVGTAK